MRVTWGKIKPGKWDEFERLWREFADRTADTKGLKTRYILRDTETDNAGYTIAVWESQADFDVYVKNRPSMKEMEDCFVGQYVATMCELRGAVPPLA